MERNRQFYGITITIIISNDNPAVEQNTAPATAQAESMDEEGYVIVSKKKKKKKSTANPHNQPTTTAANRTKQFQLVQNQSTTTTNELPIKVCTDRFPLNPTQGDVVFRGISRR